VDSICQLIDHLPARRSFRSFSEELWWFEDAEENFEESNEKFTEQFAQVLKCLLLPSRPIQ